MTGTSPRLTDDVLYRALTELAAGPDSELLLADVLHTVDNQAQVGRRAWDTRGWRRAALLVAAAALLVVAAVGTTVLLTRPQPSPKPTPSAPTVEGPIDVVGFVTEFSYSVPPGQSVTLRPQQMNTYDVYGRYDEGRKLELFPISGLIHGCLGEDEGVLATEPMAYMRALRDTEGIGLGPIIRTTFGDQPAVVAEIDPAKGTCSHPTFHVPGLRTYEPSVIGPSKLLITKASWAPSEATNGRTSVSIGILISASDEEAYAAWLPIAEAYVDSFVFDTSSADKPAWHE